MAERTDRRLGKLGRARNASVSTSSTRDAVTYINKHKIGPSTVKAHSLTLDQSGFAALAQSGGSGRLISRGYSTAIWQAAYLQRLMSEIGDKPVATGKHDHWRRMALPRIHTTVSRIQVYQPGRNLRQIHHHLRQIRAGAPKDLFSHLQSSHYYKILSEFVLSL